MKPGPERWPAVAGLWLVGLMWLLPFLNPHHQLPIPSFYGELAAVVLGVLALAALWPKRAWQPLLLPRIALLPAGLLCLILLQMLLGTVSSPQLGVLGAACLLWACMLTVLGGRLVRELGRERLAGTLAGCLLAGGLLNSGIVVLQYAGVQGSWLLSKALAQSYGNLGQSNHFANYLALATASLIYLFAVRRVPTLAFVAGALLFMAMLALSGSRSGWLYLAAMALLAWQQQRAAPSAASRRMLAACLALLPVFALLQPLLHWLLALWTPGAGPMLPTARLFDQVSGLPVRLRLWQDAWQLFLGAPWLGIGWGQFSWHTFLLAGTSAAGEFSHPAEHAHNLPLQLLAELGIAAGALLLWAAYAWIKGARQAAPTPERWWMWALLAILGIHSMLEYPLWYAYFLGIAAVLLGAGEARLLRPGFGRSGRPLLALMLLLGLWGAADLAQAYAALENWTRRASAESVSRGEWPEMNRALLQLHRESLLAPYVALMYAAASAPDRSLLEQKLRLSESAMHSAPVREVVYRHALLLALKGEHAAARRQLARAMRAYPEEAPRFVRELRALAAAMPGDFDFLLTAATLPPQGGV